jgi:hypothetical protein
MSLDRAKLSESTRRFVIARSGGCCNKCRTSVFLENDFGEKARIGDDAHIYSYSDQAARGQDTGAPVDRNITDNIILLCKNCHAQVDQQPKEFRAQRLSEIRENHYSWVRFCLGRGQIEKPRFHYLLYLNVARLDMYAAANAFLPPRFPFGDAKCLRELGLAAGQLMATYTHIFNIEDLYAHTINDETGIDSVQEGMYCFVGPSAFRTVKVGQTGDLQAGWKSGASSIYRKMADWTLICLIDPKWITTTTAFVGLSSGHARLCGVLRISSVDLQLRKVYSSPLFLAQPDGARSVF